MVERKMCSVEGCGRESVREISYLDARILEEKVGLRMRVYRARPPRRPGVVYLCGEHYKLWKKLSRGERKIRELSMRA